MLKVSVEGKLPSFEILPDDMKAMFEQAAQYMLGSVRQNFVEGGRPVTWDALKDGSQSFLFQTGALLQSIKEEAGFDFAEVAAGQLPYAWIHQAGGLAGRNHSALIPARPYMLFQDEDVDELTKVFGENIIKLIDAKGEEIHAA